MKLYCYFNIRENPDICIGIVQATSIIEADKVLRDLRTRLLPVASVQRMHLRVKARKRKQ